MPAGEDFIRHIKSPWAKWRVSFFLKRREYYLPAEDHNDGVCGFRTEYFK